MKTMKKRLISVMLTCAVFLSVLPAITGFSEVGGVSDSPSATLLSESLPFRCGDLDGNGTVDIFDTLETLKYIVNMNSTITHILATWDGVDNRAKSRRASILTTAKREGLDPDDIPDTVGPDIFDTLETLKYIVNMDTQEMCENGCDWDSPDENGCTAIGCNNSDCLEPVVVDLGTVLPPPTGEVSSDFRNLTAKQLVSEMRAGWNLGNTFDAHRGGQEIGHSLVTINGTAGGVRAVETMWLPEEIQIPGQTAGRIANATTRTLIREVRRQGFDTIRIPVSWYKAVDPNDDYKIHPSFMARVKEVVDWAVNEDMYVILNVHHDDYIMPISFVDMEAAANPQGRRPAQPIKAEDKEFTEMYLRRIWEQISEVFNNDYNEKLIFEGVNEPRTIGSIGEWSGGTDHEREMVNRLGEVFVETVRDSGGNNAYRILMVPTYAAASSDSAFNGFRIPADTEENTSEYTYTSPTGVVTESESSHKIAISVHAYVPGPFALAATTVHWRADVPSDTGPIDAALNRVRNNADRMGAAVILGEWGSPNQCLGEGACADSEGGCKRVNCVRSNTEARAAHARYYVRAARERGMVTSWWDNGAIIPAEKTTNPSHTYALFTRQSIAPNMQGVHVSPRLNLPWIIESILCGAGPERDKLDTGNTLSNQFNTDAVLGDYSASAAQAYDIFDVLEILKSIVGMSELTDFEKEVYTFNGNEGSPNIFDALEILKDIVGMLNPPLVRNMPKIPPTESDGLATSKAGGAWIETDGRWRPMSDEWNRDIHWNPPGAGMDWVENEDGTWESPNGDITTTSAATSAATPASSSQATIQTTPVSTTILTTTTPVTVTTNNATPPPVPTSAATTVSATFPNTTTVTTVLTPTTTTSIPIVTTAHSTTLAITPTSPPITTTPFTPTSTPSVTTVVTPAVTTTITPAVTTTIVQTTVNPVVTTTAPTSATTAAGTTVSAIATTSTGAVTTGAINPTGVLYDMQNDPDLDKARSGGGSMSFLQGSSGERSVQMSANPRTITIIQSGNSNGMDIKLADLNAKPNHSYTFEIGGTYSGSQLRFTKEGGTARALTTNPATVSGGTFSFTHTADYATIVSDLADNAQARYRISSPSGIIGTMVINKIIVTEIPLGGGTTPAVTTVTPAVTTATPAITTTVPVTITTVPVTTSSSVVTTAATTTAQTRFTITFNHNYSGSPSSFNVQTNGTGRINSADFPAAPTRTGYTFAGWFDTSSSSGGNQIIAGSSTGTQFNSNTTVFARWTAVSATRYTITLNPQSGAVSPTTIQTRDANANGVATLPTGELPIPTRNGYTFVGWFTSASGGTQITDGSGGSTFTANTTIHARWVDNSTGGGFRDITASQLVSEIGVGWNLGNTLDAYPNESSWSVPNTTKATIDGVKAAGFNTIRIPITWHPHISGSGSSATISSSRMNRVKQIVDWAVANDMYIIINTHHDEDIFSVTTSSSTPANTLSAVWTQIANTFKDYNEKLIFEGLNEPRDTKGTKDNSDDDWYGTTTLHERLNTLNQAFVSAVRATGGNNARRVLMVPTYAASGQAWNNQSPFHGFKKPTDTVANKLVLSVHRYEPNEFTLYAQSRTWSESGVRTALELIANASKTSSTNVNLGNYSITMPGLGMPIILGEWGATNQNNEAERARYAEFYVKEATRLGMRTVLWDNGVSATATGSEMHAYINRSNGNIHSNAVSIIEAIKKGRG
ncbi:MAG: cellulase family glycosylhydrolase [Oscillospiraceae bacterium]|nr:cellulase family glycosylhydrolase [Oscillospiraceae bacterium]